MSTPTLASPGLSRVVSAELLRARRTPGARLWLVGLVICAVQTLGWWLMATQELARWDQLLAWQTAFATALAAPLTALVAALTVRREKLARGGGTDWSPASVALVRLGRFAVTGVSLLGFVGATTVPMLLAGALLGLGAPPVARVLGLALLLWVVLLPVLALGFLVAERIGLIATVVVAVVWQALGTVNAESSGWWWIVPTWSVRPVLPVLHVHANGVAAGADEPVRQLSVWPAVGLSLVLLVVVGVLFTAAPTRGGRPWKSLLHQKSLPHRQTSSHGNTGAGSDQPRAISPAAFVARGTSAGRPQPLRAALTSTRGLGLGWLASGMLLGEVGIRVIWDPGYVRGAFGLLLLPGWVALVACLVVPAQLASARILLTRLGATRWCLALGAVLLAGLAPVVLVSALLTGYSSVRVAVVAAFVGTALLAVDLWLATALGIGAMLGVNMVQVVISMIFSAPQLARTSLWLAGPWGWAYSANTWDRALIAVVTCAVLTVVATLGWTAALRRRARD